MSRLSTIIPAFNLAHPIWLTALRRMLKGQNWWPKVWFQTWLEWQRIKKDYSELKTGDKELTDIQNRIAARIPPGSNTKLPKAALTKAM
jgi:hypothetical protein